MRVLFVLKKVPKAADTDGMARWLFNVLQELDAQDHIIDVVGLAETASQETGLSQFCAHTHIFPVKRRRFDYWRALQGWDSAKIRAYDVDLRRCLARLTHDVQYEMAFFCGHGTHAFVSSVRARRRVLVPLDANNGLLKNIGAGAISLIKKTLDDRLEAFSLRSYSAADCVLVVSEADKQLLEKVGVRCPIFVVSIGVDPNEFSPRDGKWDQIEKSILFTGVLSFPPNVSAAEYLVQHVYAEHKLGEVGIRCVIAGRQPSAPLRELCQQYGVELIGDPNDLRPIFDKALVYVAPMRTGLGMKTKVLEAMAMGLAVIGTPLAFNGITEPEGAIVCETSSEFAKIIAELALDPQRAREMGETAREFVIRRYCPRVVVEQMLTQVQSSFDSGR